MSNPTPSSPLLSATLALVAAVTIANCGGVESPEASAESDLGAVQQLPSRHVCDQPAQAGQAHCHAMVRTDETGKAIAFAAPEGFGPSDLRSAYNLPSSDGAGLTVALVDSNDDPTAEADLAVYRSQFGLPACTTANGCFRKVNQNGQSSPLPTADGGWSEEISLDLDMVSAACPSCKILLVEANSSDFSDLGAAVNSAASLGASVISNSYGGPEDSSDLQADTYYNHPGVLVTVSTGDEGYGAEYPATSPYVLAVGGTTLTKSTSNSRGWTEGAWSSGGSGCSAYEPRPSWQANAGTQCSNRAVADVAAVGDPNTGVAVYDTTVASGDPSGWLVFGGTSVSSPFVASTFALAGKASQSPGFPYSNSSDFYGVTTGSNGTCSPSLWCTAGAGWNGPTGIGTPNGVAIAGGAGGTGGGSGGGTGGGSGGGSGSASCSLSGSTYAQNTCTQTLQCNTGAWVSRSSDSQKCITGIEAGGACLTDSGAIDPLNTCTTTLQCNQGVWVSRASDPSACLVSSGTGCSLAGVNYAQNSCTQTLQCNSGAWVSRSSDSQGCITGIEPSGACVTDSGAVDPLNTCTTTQQCDDGVWVARSSDPAQCLP